MKRIYLSLLAALALLFAPHALAGLNTVSYNAYYTGDITVGTDTLGGVTYATVNYGDLYNGGDPGKPSLPIDYIRFSVPYNATNFTVTALATGWNNYTLNHLLYPCQAPWIPDETGTPRPITLPDTAAYYSGTTYPPHLAWVVDEGFLAGENHIVTVAVMPISYTHTSTSDKLKKARSLNIRLNYTLSDTLAMYPIIRNDSALRQEGYELAQSMVVNPNQVVAFAPVDLSTSNDSIGGVGPLNGGDGLNGGGGQPITPPDSLGLPTLDTIPITPDPQYNDNIDNSHYYPYIIITTPALCHSARRLAALKRQKGFNVLVLTLDQIYNSPISMHGDIEKDKYGNDVVSNSSSAGKIRQFLKYAYQYLHTDFVLLVGTGVPFMYHNPIPTDFYYCEFNSNYYQRKYEHNPELYIGRILAKSPDQIDNYTDKLLRYELNPGKGDHNYLRRALFHELKEFNDYLSTVTSNLGNVLPSQTVIQEILNGNYPKGSDIINQINNNQFGFWGAFTHGDTTRVKTYGTNNSSNSSYFVYTSSVVALGDSMNNGLDAIHNKDYPMICYMPNCVTMPYKSSRSSFGEVFITGKDFGGPAYMGSTFSIDEMPSKILFEHFSQNIDRGEYRLGVADARSKDYVSVDNSRIHNYLGDPSLELWTDVPQQYSGLSVLRTDTSMTVSNITVPSTIVAYYNTDSKLCKNIVSSSSVTIKANPNYPVMLYKHNCLPIILPLFLQNTQINHNRYVIASDVIAGNSVDTIRTHGDVVIISGTQYEIEASGEVRLDDGFEVELGAEFVVQPSCF